MPSTASKTIAVHGGINHPKTVPTAAMENSITRLWNQTRGTRNHRAPTTSATDRAKATGDQRMSKINVPQAKRVAKSSLKIVFKAETGTSNSIALTIATDTRKKMIKGPMEEKATGVGGGVSPGPTGGGVVGQICTISGGACGGSAIFFSGRNGSMRVMEINVRSSANKKKTIAQVTGLAQKRLMRIECHILRYNVKRNVKIRIPVNNNRPVKTDYSARILNARATITQFDP